MTSLPGKPWPDYCLTYQVDVDTTGLAAVNELARLSPGDWLTWDLAGQVMFFKADYARAQEFLDKAHSLDSSQPAVSVHLALVYLEQGDGELAYVSLQEAISLDPQGPYGVQAARLIEQLFP